MRESEYQKINKHFETLVSELDLTNTLIIDYLFQVKVLAETDKDDLKNTPTNHRKNRRLLEILRTKEDAAYGHFLDALQKHQRHLAADLEPPGVPRTVSSRPRGSGVGKGFEDFSSTEVQDWLKPRLEKEQIPDEVLKTISDEEIDGKVFLRMTETDLKEVFSYLKFGPRKKLSVLRDEILQASLPHLSSIKSPLPRQQRTEYAREFGSTPLMSDKYYQNKILNKHVSCTNNSMLEPARQFVPCIDDSERADIYDFIGEKVTTFSAACLNERRNGTIYFGIGDTNCERYSYGEVLGVPLSKKECEDAIVLFIKERFSQETVQAAFKCIKVVFVEVILPDREENHTHFVLEVDIEPKVSIVENLAFFLKPGALDTTGDKKVLYRLKNGTAAKQDPDEVVKFSEEKSMLNRNRQQEEKLSPSRQTQNLLQLLKNFLCGGGDWLDGGYCPLLATGAVDPSQEGFKESFQFVSSLDWRCIFDFDADSGEKGLYQFLDGKEEMLYKVKTAGDFCSPSYSDAKGKTSMDEMFQDMNESELKTWIFCNGYDVAGERGLNIAQWKRQRSSGFREAVRIFRNNIPGGRAVVVILLTSKDDVFIEASEELLLSFQDQWLMISESKQLADAWIDGLLNRNVEVDRKRCLYNFSFADVSKAVQQLQGIEAFTEDVCVVRSPSGLQKEIPKKKVQELCNLDIVSAKECSAADEKVGIDELSKKQEEEFYKGNTATWWNFYFSGHVCPRDKLEELKKLTRDALAGDGDFQDGDKVGFVEVYHQPGAGGTTVAMNVVWDLHREFTSCLVKRITKDTAGQILTLYEFPDCNPDSRRSVLAMIDNEDDKIDDLKRDIEEECQTRGIHRLVCVFLVCFRRMALPAGHHFSNILLEQKLSVREKQFFIDKYAELKKKGRANLDSLLGLNIMKENFNEDYIKRTVACFLQLQSVDDKTVLKYTAILNCYDLSFRAIPVACFDVLMKARRGSWEEKLSAEPLMLFTRNIKLPGRNKCVRITSQLLCKYILDELCKGAYDSHADLMEEFLFSPVFHRQSPDFAFRELQNVVKDCMKKRGMTLDGKKRCKFSPFIQMLYDDEEIDRATQCIEIVFDKTGDAFLAQNIARVYICAENWNKADEWAREATKRLPNNSFLWDTRGQICRSRLAEIRATCEADHTVDPEIVASAVDYARIGYEVFEKVEELSKKERSDPPNTSGLFGKMEIVLLLSKILKCLPGVASKDDLQGLFTGKSRLPMKQLSLSQTNITWLGSLQESTLQCLKSLEDQMMTTNVSGFSHDPTKFFLGKDNIGRFEDRLNDLFGEDSPGLTDPQKIAPEKRQKQMRRLGGNSLYSVMNQCSKGENGNAKAEKILQLASLNLKEAAGSGPMSNYDLTMALASSLTLVCCYDNALGSQDYSNLLTWSKALFEKNKKPDWERFINFDPYQFLLVFHWPTPNRQHFQEQCDPVVLRTATDLAREALSKLHARQNRNHFQQKNNPQFFLTQKPDRNSVISKERLVALCGQQTARRMDRLLRHKEALRLVERFSGVLMKNGTEVKVGLISRRGNKVDLTIPVYLRVGKQSLWNKKVYFALGVGLGGPIACDVDADIPTPNRSVQSLDRAGQYGFSTWQCMHPLVQIDRQIEEVQQHLDTIRCLHSKQTKTPDEVKRIREEPGLQKRLSQLQRQRREHELDEFV